MNQAPENFTALRDFVHEALRAQHPDWITPDGDCPACREYESRLEATLAPFAEEHELAAV